MRGGTAGLPSFGLFAAVLAAAGLPIYIHAPAVYAAEHGVSLAALGVVLALLRAFDFVQDPALGWLSRKLGRRRAAAVAAAGGVMAAAMIALFAVPPVGPPLLWFALSLALLFSAFSFLTITFYSEGVAKAAKLGDGGHVRVAAWRETGALLGVCVASVMPIALGLVFPDPYAAYAFAFAALALLALLTMRREWTAAPPPSGGSGFRRVLADGPARRLLGIALVNAAPVAVTSTLFLFFVNQRLAADGWEGPLLLLFFVSAAASAPVWARVAGRIGEKRALLAGMALAVLSFGWAVTLGAGDVAAFAVICLASGAALGADMTLLPAIFAARMARIDPGAAEGFGLWSFVSKASLAIAAATLLPVLEAAGFDPAANQNPDRALHILTWLYAAVPCGLKVIAFAALCVSDVGTAPNMGRATREVG